MGIFSLWKVSVSVLRPGGSLLKKGKNAEAAFLKFAEKKKILKMSLYPGKKSIILIFPDKKTEVGGIKPFVMINPPADTLAMT